MKNVIIYKAMTFTGWYITEAETGRFLSGFFKTRKAAFLYCYYLKYNIVYYEHGNRFIEPKRRNREEIAW